MRAVAVEAAGIGKRFGSITALQDVSFRVAAGSVHALLGENGAGKSTVVKCLLGYHRADAGSFLVDGREAAITRAADADRLGLGMVYQHFTLVPSMTVAENLVMARRDVPRVLRWQRERAALDAFMATVPFRLPLDVPAGALAAGQRQKTEILKQLYLQRRVLVLDEPTSVLTPQEAEEVLGLVRGLAEAGQVTVIVITHKLREVARFADDVTVMRRGRVAGGGAAAALPAEELTRMMMGQAHQPARLERLGGPAAACCRIEGLRATGDSGRTSLDLAHLAVAGREIVGVAGISGNGQRELVEVLAGQRPADAGIVLVEGQPYRATRAEAQARGVRVLPEEPLRSGCVRQMSVADNLSFRTFDRRGGGGLRRLRLEKRGMAARAARMIAWFRIRTPSPQAPIGLLSGGNVQRCVLARELDGDVRLLIAANPCFGLDVGAAAEVRARIVAARNEGAAVLLVSEDLEELVSMADRIVVMREGRIVHELANDGSVTIEGIGRHMVGGQ